MINHVKDTCEMRDVRPGNEFALLLSALTGWTSGKRP